jgi:radical SAM protein with 4Fe4S-binding SPASM domain
MNPHLVELNITELCNRTCSFCPRAWDYPNQNLNMTLSIADLIAQQCIGFTDNIHLVGRGEPLLHPEFLDIVRIFSKNFSVKIVTNGDKLYDYIDELDNILDLQSKNHTITICLYDDDNQYNHFKLLYSKYNDVKLYKTYDTGNNLTDDTLAKQQWLTNRAGAMPVNRLKNKNAPCYLPVNRVYIDYDGSVNLCCHDWKYKTVYGDIKKTSIATIWNNDLLNIKRKLVAGDRSCTNECSNCDVVDDPLKYIYNDYLDKQNLRIIQLHET